MCSTRTSGTWSTPWSRLDTLRVLLIKKEDAALQRLLEEVRRQAETYQANEQKRQQLRRELAADLGCTPGEVTLSQLAAERPGSTATGRAAALRSRRGGAADAAPLVGRTAETGVYVDRAARAGLRPVQPIAPGHLSRVRRPGDDLQSDRGGATPLPAPR